MTRIKVSGITNPKDAEVVASAGVDMVACVFHARSPRYVTARQAWDIRSALPAGLPLVGVFADTPVPLVQLIADQCRLDLIQLFGHESKADLDTLGEAAFKGLTLSAAPEVDIAVRAYGTRRGREQVRPGLLLHLTGPLAEAWELATGPAARLALIVAAGGLRAETAATAIRLARPWGLDVWDAVESAPGQIDPSRIREFVAAVREADPLAPPAARQGDLR